MRASSPLLNAAKKGSITKFIPVELTPLFIACGVACASAIYFTSKKLSTDKTLRLGRSNPTFNEKFEEVISKDE
ncbi:hypothetical protein B5S31_g2069 [[Candida] boidinii]|nr:hypothetical protein B5S29_g3470 [[Candida] boidinii]OWB72362.1 hypothetical protein B5S31_g2069 [[Candida] boidinii]OWB79344.1 hypothetical protein B5S32_g3564 [[Candida] boidinii]